MNRLLALAAFATSSAIAATFIVPTDASLIHASKAIVIVTAGESHTRRAPGGWIETVTSLHVDEAIKGPLRTGEVVEVVELGGAIGNIAYTVPGSPAYGMDEHVLLFLDVNDRHEWASKNMVVGKFVFANARLVRETMALIGCDEPTCEVPSEERHC